MFKSIRAWANRLMLEIMAIYVASKDSRTPHFAKLLAVVTVAYAFSPIDLIPDFIPILGLLDDLIIVPAGIAIIIRIIPNDLMGSFRQDARVLVKPSSNRTAAMLIIVLWIMVGAAVWILINNN